MIYWKSKSNSEMKLVVSSTPLMPKAQKRITKLTIPGRNGFITIDEGVYESFVLSVSCHFGADANRDDILAWLDGSGKLSLDNIREYDAVISNSIALKKVTNVFKEFVVQFDVQPIGVEKTENTFTVNSNPKTLTIEDVTADMLPTIEITGSGDVTVTINNQTFNLYDMDGKFILDCNLKVITKGGVNVANKMLYDFPKLSPGANVISYTGTITEFVIKYKKCYL